MNAYLLCIRIYISFFCVSYRVVDFTYMPDLAIENARNVTINLKEEHGQYVMLQLNFAAKWILISEITFVSGKHNLRWTLLIM